MSKIQTQRGKAGFIRNWLHLVERYPYFGKRFRQIPLRELLVGYFT